MNSIVSWSGGKDSCLALWRSQKSQNVSGLLIVLDETGIKARSHGVSIGLLDAQAKSLGLRNYYITTSWKDYELRFISTLLNLSNHGITQIIFGDIDLQAHKDWEEKVSAQAGLNSYLPLWNENRLLLVHEFLELGFKARVVCVDGRVLDKSYVGVEFNQQFIESLPKNVDPCGENGEFHTFVYDGPNFKCPVPWKSLGINSYISPLQYGNQTYYFDLLDI